MRNRILPLLGVAAFAFTGCSSDTTEKACTLIFCRSQVTLTVALPTGEKPTALAVDLLVDGVPVSCPVLGDETHLSCAPTVHVSLRQGEVCEDTTNGAAVVHTCSPDGTFHLGVEIWGTPASVAYTVSSEGVPVLQDTLAPTYTTLTPNGPGCGPVCQQASLAVTLPAP